VAEISAGFVELRPYLGQCRFSNCSHRVEPDCALQQALADGHISAQRFESFLRLLETRD
jgi:ribosome biogenesis GTPase